MAFHTKNDFAKLCGLQPKNLYTYIDRKKVFVINNLIDDTDQNNKLFLEKQRSKRGLDGDQPEAVKTKVVKAPKKESTDEEIRTKNTLTDLLKEKNGLEIHEKKNRIEMQKFEIQKKRGELIPTASVKSLVTLHSENMKTAYVEASDNLIVILAQRKGMSATELSDVRKQFLIIVNKAIDNAVDSSKRMLGVIVEEFSAKRGVGQHE